MKGYVLENKLGIIYNRKRIQRIMRKYNIVCPIRKANPYRRMAKATKEESLMIGDNLEADIMGALDFGMEAICFNYHKETLGADIIGVDHLVELKKYI